MDLLQSKTIKPLLINLYDFQYKRYENEDAINNHKYQYQLRPLIKKITKAQQRVYFIASLLPV